LIDPTGKVTTWKRDVQGRTTEKLLSDGKRYLYTYEPLSGRLATVSYPKDVLASQVTFTNRYHLNGQLQKKDYTDAGVADVTFTAADFMGRSGVMSDGAGTHTPTYVALSGTLNGAAQLASLNGPLANDTLRYTYDWRGRVVKNEVVADDGTTVLRSEESTLDTLGRVTQTVNDLGTFAAAYGSGNLSPLPDSVALPGGFSTHYTRHAANAGTNALRLQTIHHKHGANTVQKHDYTYDITGSIASWDRTNSTANVASWALRHDAGGQLSELDESLDSVPQKKEAWHYDPAGNVASSMEVPAGLAGTLEIRTHSGRNQLSQMGGPGKTMVEGTSGEAATVTVNGQSAKVTKVGSSGPWRFEREFDFPSGPTTIAIEATDGTSNVTAQSYSVNVGTGASKTLTYDANGNLTQVMDGTNVVTRVCEWDADNRLLAIQSAATPALGVKRSEFVYDGIGRRVRQVEKIHDGSQWAIQSDWKYVMDGLKLVQKRDANSGGVLVNYFTTGEQQGGDAIVYFADHLGSVRQWYRVSDGVQGDAQFSPWGLRSVTTTGPGVPERAYTGHLYHPASGLVLAPFRAYDAELGRWISEDPMGALAGSNLYAYVFNSPGMWVDPFGLFRWGRFIAGVATMAVGVATAIVTAPSVVGALSGGAMVMSGLMLASSALVEDEKQLEQMDNLIDNIPTDPLDVAGKAASAVTGDPMYETYADAAGIVYNMGKALPAIFSDAPKWCEIITDIAGDAAKGMGKAEREGTNPLW
jgi:RHS repeat-associated protein